jgi:hypothetical protein
VYIFYTFAEKFQKYYATVRLFTTCPDKGFAQQRPGLAKCGGGLVWEWSEANDLAKTEAEGALAPEA